jgi:2-methylcitrate dehydratase PrpD
MSIADQLVNNVVQTRFENLEKQYIEKAKVRVLDSIGCALAGVKGPGCGMMLELVRRWGGAEESTIIAFGGKAPAHNAAMMNSLLTRSFDFEPVEAEGEKKTSAAHISGTTVPTALAISERQAASGKDFIAALVTGDDLAARLGIASGFDFSLGWDNTGTINLFGATAIAGKLLGLDEKRLFNAFGIALNQCAGTMAGIFDKTLAFKLPIALSCRDAIFAAELAKEGFSGVNDPFSGPRGFFALYCRNPDSGDLTKDIGKRYFADCVIKPYSACRATHMSIDCALQISRQKDIKAEEVQEIIVQTAPAAIEGFVGVPFSPGDTPQINGAFSIRYTVATALLRKAVRPEFFSDEHIFDPSIKTIIEKIVIAPVSTPEQAQTTHVQVRMKDGKTYSAHTDFPRGDFRRTPLTREEIEDKYRSNVAFSKTISPQNGEKVLDIINNLEELDDVRELTRLLVEKE